MDTAHRRPDQGQLLRVAAAGGRRRIMVAGSYRPLEDAFRIAHTQLIRWISSQTGLSAMDTYQLVTQARSSPIANVFDANYTVVAGMPKRYLPDVGGWAGRTSACGRSAPPSDPSARRVAGARATVDFEIERSERHRETVRSGMRSILFRWCNPMGQAPLKDPFGFLARTIAAGEKRPPPIRLRRDDRICFRRWLRATPRDWPNTGLTRCAGGRTPSRTPIRGAEGGAMSRFVGRIPVLVVTAAVLAVACSGATQSPAASPGQPAAGSPAGAASPGASPGTSAVAGEPCQSGATAVNSGPSTRRPLRTPSRRSSTPSTRPTRMSA